MSQPRESDRLGAILRQGDPAANEPSLSASERLRIGASARAAAAGVGRATWLPVAVAAALAIAFGVWWSAPTRPARPGPGPEAPGAGSAPSPRTLLQPRTSLAARHPVQARADEATAASRELHFTAPKGTRIVWSIRQEAGSVDAVGAGARSRS